MTFSIERIISNIDELNKFQDIAKIMLILTASYLMITCAYTLPKTLLEISEAKKAFTNHQNKDQ
jgi:hypothetical protein